MRCGHDIERCGSALFWSALTATNSTTARNLLALLYSGTRRKTHRMRKEPRNPEPAKRWAAFLSNHRGAIAAMDFFTVPTLTFGVLYCFFVIAHDRRRILHCNVTRQPTALNSE